MQRDNVGYLLYDADSRVLNMETLEKVMNDERKAGNWYTKQHWRAIVFFENDKWNFQQILPDKSEGAKFEENTIFELIATVLEHLGA